MTKVRVKDMGVLPEETRWGGKSVPLVNAEGQWEQLNLDDYDAHVAEVAQNAATQDIHAATEAAKNAGAAATQAIARADEAAKGAEVAKTNAEKAATEAQTSAASAATATQKAKEAAQSSSASALSAKTAEGKAAEAAASVKAAEGKVTSAVKAATDSAASAASAQTSAANAEGKATQSAASAKTSATEAANAKTAAEQAKQNATEAHLSAQQAADNLFKATNEAADAAASAKAAEGKVTTAETAAKDSAASAAASAASAEKAKATCDGMAAKVEELMLGAEDHIAAAWDGTTNERAVAEAGDKELIDFKAFLIDKTDNKGEYSTPAGVLMRNNYLRFEDGSYAPTVGITEEMRAQTDGEVYRKANGQLTKYCGAGEYDAATFYETYGANEKLYDAKGNEIHALMPWETTETKYSVGTGYDRPLWMIDNAEGKSGKIWKEISTQPHIWDGINPVKLEPTAISPSGVFCIEENGVTKTRCFFNLYEGTDKGSVHCKGHMGAGDVSDMFYGKRTYPTTSGIQQIKNMDWARNNNADTTKSYPFAEGGMLYRDMFIAYLEMKYGRKDISNENFFGSGISSNSSCNNEDAWTRHGGVRFKKPGSAAWEYDYWAAKPSGVYINASKKQTNWSDMLNSQYAKEQCMESQMAASWAAEMNVPEGEHYMMYGGEYYWTSVPGTMGLLDGRMNVIIHKIVRGEVNAYDAQGAPMKVTAEVNLRMSLFEGVTLAGDIYCYWGGGYEVVGETLESSAGGGTYGEPVDIYLQPDQKKWESETLTTKPDKGKFDFEKTYIYIARDKTKGGYALRTIPFTNFPLTTGGGLTKGDCYYFYNSNWWAYSTPGTRCRIGFRPRGFAHYAACAPRHVFANYAAFSTHAYYGGSEQTLLPPAIKPQA